MDDLCLVYNFNIRVAYVIFALSPERTLLMRLQTSSIDIVVKSIFV